MLRHDPARLWAFLAKLDAALDEPTELVVIGGGALALAWDGQHATPDLDLFVERLWGSEQADAVEASWAHKS